MYAINFVIMFGLIKNYKYVNLPVHFVSKLECVEKLGI